MRATATEARTGAQTSHAIARVDIRLVSDAERERHFREAARHTRLVLILRRALPIGAVALLGLYVVFMRHAVSLPGGGKLDPGLLSISTTDLTMIDPVYEGLSEANGRYKITARKAKQELKSGAPIGLETIVGRLLRGDGTLTTLKATRGTYDSGSGVLELYDGIDIFSDDGLRGVLSRATVMSKEGKIVSREPVRLEGPLGRILANAMEVQQKVKHITFSEGVNVLLNQAARAAKPDPKAAAAAKASPGSPLDSLTGGASGPVTVAAPTLNVDDGTHVAIFSGGVKAFEGDSRMETAELEIHYVQKSDTPPGAAKPAAPQPALAGGLDAGAVKEVLARQPVVLTRGEDRVTARSARFDGPSNVAFLDGDVVMTRGEDKVTAKTARYDANAGVAFLDGGVLMTSANGQQVTGDRAEVNTKTNAAVVGGHVVLQAGADRQAVGDLLETDTAGDAAVLKGNVRIMQGRDVLTGRKVSVDRKTGVTDVTAAAEDGLPAGRITALFHTGDAQAKPGGKTPAAPVPNTESGAWSVRVDPGSPVNLEADSLHAVDAERKATFLGAVKVVQGDMTMLTNELIAHYSGPAGLALPAGQAGAGGLAGLGKAAAGAKPAAGQPGDKAADITHIEAVRGVTVTTGDGHVVNGDHADFDVKANRVTITAAGGRKVTIEQGKEAKIACTAVIVEIERGLAHCGGEGAGQAGLGVVTSAAGSPGAKARQEIILFPSAIEAAQKKDGSGKDPKAGTAKPGTTAPLTSITDGWSASKPGKSP